jgi:hypothetical protein
MKNLYSATLLFVGIVITTCSVSSCKKTDTISDKPKEEGVLGNWAINRVQLKLYYNGVFFKDTILPAKPKPTNYMVLGAVPNGSFEYRLNVSSPDVGTYQFKGADSLIANTSSKTYRWKMLTLTDVLFTVVSTSTNDPAFPGAKVETYQTFVR